MKECKMEGLVSKIRRAGIPPTIGKELRIKTGERRAESAKHTSPGRNPGISGPRCAQALKGRDTENEIVCRALSGLEIPEGADQTQGSALGLYVPPFQGSPKSVTTSNFCFGHAFAEREREASWYAFQREALERGGTRRRGEHPLFLNQPVPSGTTDNSPAIHCRGGNVKAPQVPLGTTEKKGVGWDVAARTGYRAEPGPWERRCMNSLASAPAKINTSSRPQMTSQILTPSNPKS